MVNETTLTVVGNLVDTPELRYTGSGAPVTNVVVASTPRAFVKGEWVGDTLFLRCNVWREQAEHVASSLGKGDRVVVTGRLKQRSFERDGERRTVIELDAEEVGASLRYTAVTVAKNKRRHVDIGHLEEASAGEDDEPSC